MPQIPEQAQDDIELSDRGGITDNGEETGIETTSSGVAYRPVGDTVIDVPGFRDKDASGALEPEISHANGHADVPPVVGATALKGAHHAEAETGGPQTSDSQKPDYNGAKPAKSSNDNVDASKFVAGELANVLGQDPLAMSSSELSHAIGEVIRSGGLPGNVTVSQAYGLVAAARRDPRWRPFDKHGRQSNGISVKKNGTRRSS